MEDDKFVSDIKTKADIINKLFTGQCTPLKNKSKLPSNQMTQSINQSNLTQSRLVSLNFNEDEILRTIRALNPLKVHGYDDISIRMIKICDKLLLKPLMILFKNSTKSHYPDICKIYIPVHKKND